MANKKTTTTTKQKISLQYSKKKINNQIFSTLLRFLSLVWFTWDDFPSHMLWYVFLIYVCVCVRVFVIYPITSIYIYIYKCIKLMEHLLLILGQMSSGRQRPEWNLVLRPSSWFRSRYSFIKASSEFHVSLFDLLQCPVVHWDRIIEFPSITRMMCSQPYINI